jgi:hypothetical protein
LSADAVAWRKRADLLLKESRLLEIVEGFGEARLSGSYVYDLMLGPDIDMHLLPHRFDRQTAVSIHTALIVQNWWNRFYFEDWVDERFRSSIRTLVVRGFYIGVQRDVDGTVWKIDIWVVDPARFPGDLIRNRMMALTEEERMAILLLKDARNLNVIDRCASVRIYRAVLDGVRSVEDFRAWETSRPER